MNSISDFLLSGALPFEAPLTIVEIGAHVGTHSRWLRRVFPAARVFCFEPDPRNAYEFRNRGTHREVTLVEAAIGDTDGTADLNLSSGRPPAWTGHADVPKTWTQSSSLRKPTGHLRDFPWATFERTARVRVMRLDTFCEGQGLADIDFIWADTQGAEGLMIAGGPGALARTRFLYSEYSDRELYEGQLSLAEIVRRLPGHWEILARFEYDALLWNTAFSGAGPVAGPKE